jgi:hypothetical protein
MNWTFRHIILIGFTFLTIPTTSAQSNQLGNWWVYFGNQKVNQHWNIQSDIQYRNYQIWGQRNQFLGRVGLGYNLKEQNHNLLIGYAYVASDVYDNEDVFKNTKVENRVYQQYLFRKNRGSYFFTHRIRMEERFFPSEFGLRGRYFISLQKPLNGKTLGKHTTYLSAYNELFVDLKRADFDRNRIYLGIGYGITNDIRIETGYMIQAQKNMQRGQLQFILINNVSFDKIKSKLNG